MRNLQQKRELENVSDKANAWFRQMDNPKH
jgi:hypothetical protein